MAPGPFLMHRPHSIDFTEAWRYEPVDFAGLTQLVECQLPKLDVAGSNPVSRSVFFASSGVLAVATTGAGRCACGRSEDVSGSDRTNERQPFHLVSPGGSHESCKS
jgi:hypothetical protein